MIQEDYVSFDTAKLLKEKGFKGQGEHFYEDNKVTNFANYWHRISPEQRYKAIEAPTLQMAMKWLREMYGLMIVVHPSYPIDGIKYESLIYRLTELKDASVDEYNYDDKEYDNYEQACESAIKYCIENLI